MANMANINYRSKLNEVSIWDLILIILTIASIIINSDLAKRDIMVVSKENTLEERILSGMTTPRADLFCLALF